MTTPQDRHLFGDVPGPKLNVGCGPDVRPPAQGWTNMDGYFAAPGVLLHDILEFPWPLEDASFDLVYCSHVLEHIPPALVEKEGRKRDVLFVVMEEIHRVLRPGGKLVIRVPWGGSQAGLIHIQHYRQWMPEWAYYFDPANAESVYSNARFRTTWWKRTRATESLRGKHHLRFGPSRISLAEHLAIRLPLLHRVLFSPSELEMHLVRLDPPAK